MDKAKTAQKYGKIRCRSGENAANVRKNTKKSVKIGENAGVSRDYFDFVGRWWHFLCFRSAVFSPFGSFFCFLGGHSLFFALSPSSFCLFFSSGGVKICDFLSVFPPFFAVNACFLWLTDAFSWFFYEKGENRRKNRRNFGEFMLFFCVFFVFSQLFGLFSWCFLLVFFDFREKRVLSGVFLRLFLFFGGIIAFFICFFSSSAFDFLQSNKKRQF